MSDEKFTVVGGSIGDFLQVQNYILQLVAEKKLTASAFVLYSFYKSVAGFDNIYFGYDYISANCGLSKGNITKSNKLLIKENLIELKFRSEHMPKEVLICNEVALPRRVLKPTYKVEKKELDKEKIDHSKHIIYSKEGEQLDISLDHEKLLKVFTDFWKNRYRTEFYSKNDLETILQIKDPENAIKYVPILWSLDDIDKWVRDSDHSVTIFVKEYLAGKLQAHYPNTRYSYT